MTELGPRIEAAIAAFDALNAADPTLVEIEGKKEPRQLVHARRLSTWLEKLDPDPSTALRLAARCQHLMRWKIPRSSFPEGRTGYHRWRRHLAEFHADQATRILRDLGWDDETVNAVRKIVLKQGISKHADVQTMEDALCLEFIESGLEQFAQGRQESKLLGIVRDTWRKMSPHGRSFAPALLGGLSGPVRALVERAVAEAG